MLNIFARASVSRFVEPVGGWLARAGIGPTALLCLVSAQVICYIKARAEACSLYTDGGMVERAERYIITLLGAGLAGLGVPFAFDVALWSLAGLQIVTVTQRMLTARRGAWDREAL